MPPPTPTVPGKATADGESDGTLRVTRPSVSSDGRAGRVVAAGYGTGVPRTWVRGIPTCHNWASSRTVGSPVGLRAVCAVAGRSRAR